MLLTTNTIRGYIFGLIAIFVAAAPASAASNLEIYIRNGTSKTLVLTTDSATEGSFHSAPETIESYETTGNIDLTHTDGIGRGKLGYEVKNDSTTCSFEMDIQYENNYAGKNCDSKKFDIKNNSSCEWQLSKSGSCYGSGDCKCNFVFE